MKKDDTRVYLWVSDFGDDASVVTQLIGLEPTRIHASRLYIPGSLPTKSQWLNWEFSSSLPSSAHIDEHIEALLRVLEPRAAAIKNVSQFYKAGINAVVYYNEDFTPSIHLTEHVIKVMADMGLSVDFDPYFLQDT